MRYLRASHFGPTVLVTTLAFLFSRQLFSVGSALLVALTIFTGQLLVGWTNDLVDYRSDLEQKRSEKPLVEGPLTVQALRRATLIDLPICVGLSLFGPLGFRGGSLHLLGVGCGLAYNFYFKSTVLSPLPYAIAFASLPATPYIATDTRVPWWMVAVGALFGIVAHFANVLKDIAADQEIGINGLPQRLSIRTNVLICLLLLAAITVIISQAQPSLTILLISLNVIGASLIIARPEKLAFPIIMALALISVLALIY